MNEEHYCERVTADDGAVGEQYLKEFCNNENVVPTVLTTSQKTTFFRLSGR